ncbi:MAG: AsnC family transcriptional regulator [Chloroflexota bacterium]
MCPFDYSIRTLRCRTEHPVDEELPMTDVVLDDLDRAILRELQADGRISNLDLSRRIDLSPPATQARADRAGPRLRRHRRSGAGGLRPSVLREREHAASSGRAHRPLSSGHPGDARSPRMPPPDRGV